ncbi:hypothetical protein PPYR_10156 [Photinus pyralis]|uniref:Ketoreductase domain-containing protein n=1 Tax=Photinus pyralis TaxID=7054 RepID=A0A1Y1N3U0_PHOPY|nr:15-hydroxyprostaglandin dehydrogenase [NAD(+)]-like [Photinus pyralis]KAB0796095.1 hypothetical protein PPYR_10156 [Photinus pyralis]
MFEIYGKVALVTGGAGGIGLAIAKELLKNGLKGVAIVDTNQLRGNAALHDIRQEFGEGKAIFLHHDVSVRSQFEDAFKAVIEAFQNLDIVVNNAGIYNEKDWERTIAVNLMGTVNGTMLALENYLPQNKKGEEAVILNVSSIAAFLFCPAAPSYTASKCGILALTSCMGQHAHYQRKKVRVMAICPSTTATELYTERKSTAINEEYVKLLEDFMEGGGMTYELQWPEDVARGAVQIIKEANNGSIWMAEDKKPPYEVDFVAMNQVKR